MKTIGEQVREFRTTRKLKPADLARMVGTKRQHIEQLEAAGNRIPKYLGDLAAVMGVTSDHMLATAGLAKARPATPAKAAKGAVFEALSTEERELLSQWRLLLGSDRRAKFKEIAKLAKLRQAEREELFAEAGLTAIAEKAALYSRTRTAASVEVTGRLKQRQLLEDLDEKTVSLDTPGAPEFRRGKPRKQ